MHFLLLISWLLTFTLAAGFCAPVLTSRVSTTPGHHTVFFAKKKPKKKAAARGGGFGSTKRDIKPKAVTISADKGSLEKQWDTFVGITDLEITPKGDENFEVVDVFVRTGSTPDKEGTKWFRVGKVCANDDSTVDIALTLQKGLILWTAVHMRRELVAAGGKSGAAMLELGYTGSTMNVGCETDDPVDEEEDGIEIQIAERVSGLQDVTPKSFGFRPDWNPPGFTYKRRESSAMKKNKLSGLEEIAAIDDDEDE